MHMLNPSFPDMILRLVLALAAGLLLGLERGLKGKPVDFRAYGIVGVTAALAAVTALRLVDELPLEKSGLGMDPSRIIQAVLMGIAFLGSATIIKHEDKEKVVGTATGAAIWAAGGIGVALGFGFYVIALTAFACIFLTLVAL